LALYNIIEIIIREFDYPYGNAYSSITNICKNKLNLNSFDNDLSEIVCTRNVKIHIDCNAKHYCQKNYIKNHTQEHILKWLKVIQKILELISNLKQ
jgi:hypothetical protein